MTSSSYRPSRRQVLAGGTAATVAAMSGGLGRLIEQAYASEPTKHASINDIDHFVFLMMENRSFDHYFGTMPGVRGFGDKKALPGVFEQRGYKPGHGPDKHGHLPPFHLKTKDLTSWSECVDDITHNWMPQHNAFNGGKMNRWVLEHLANDTNGSTVGPITMGYYEHEDVSFYRGLANAFTICDEYYCSVLGPTDPNRVMWFSGTIDPDGTHGGPCLDTLVSNRSTQYGKFTWKTMPEVLQEAGVSWKIYQDTTAETLLNPLPYFKSFAPGGDPTLVAKANDVTSSLAVDVATKQLPSVSWVFPTFAECDHPSAPPIYGEQFIAHVLKTLVSNRDVWEKTALIVMYDENGGFFDHVPPPVPPKGTSGEFLTMPTLPAAAQGVRGPVGLGFRVPCLVISPYSRGGITCSEVFDHTSQLQLISKRFGVEVPNVSHWRRHATGNMTGAFSFGQKRRLSVPALPGTHTSRDGKIVDHECIARGQALAGVFDQGVPTPVPHHVTPPHQTHRSPRRPVR